MTIQNEQLPIFVYGTLREGARNHGVIRPYAFRMLPGLTRGKLVFNWSDLEGYLPMLLRKGQDEIKGELVEIFPEMYEEAIKRLDQFEHEGTLYNRERARVDTKNGFVDAWVYFYARDRVPNAPYHVQQGDYFAYVSGSDIPYY